METENILIIDENEDISAHLDKFHYTYLHCIKKTYGERAIKLLAKKKFDLVILAHCLPDIDGLEVLHMIRSKYPQIPVIFVAASPSFDLAISVFRLGAADFFRRPIHWKEMESKIFSILNLNKADRDSKQTSYKKAVVVKNGMSFAFINDLIFEKNWLKWLSKLKANKNSTELLHSDKNNVADQKKLEQTDEIQESLIARNCTKQKSTTDDFEQVFLSSLKIYFLGKFNVLVNEQPIEYWPSRKVKSLFAFFVYHHKKRIYRDILMDKFWPNHSLDSARNCLNVAIHSLRKVLFQIDPDQNFILYKDECYFLNHRIEIWTDVEEFLQHWKVAQSAERQKEILAALSFYELAAALYKGEFMEDDLYETWQDLERENLKEIYLAILDRISNYYSLDGKPDLAINLCKQILEKDNCREDIHQRIMRCYYRLGKRDKAIRQYYKCVGIMKDELDVEPMRSTFELYQQIKQDYFENL